MHLNAILIAIAYLNIIQYYTNIFYIPFYYCKYIFVNAYKSKLLLGVIFGHGAMFVITPVVIKFFFDKENASNKTQDAQVESTYQINYMLDLQMEYNSLLIQSIICEMFYVLVLTSINVLYIMCVEHCCGLFEALR